MRVVIDLQACQSAPHRNRGIGRYSMALTKALLRNAVDDEIWVALNGEVAGTVEPIRAALSGLIDDRRIVVWRSVADTALAQPTNQWRHAAAMQVRDAFLAQIKPDVVHVSSLFEGYHDDVVTSVPTDGSYLTSVSLYDLIPLALAETYLVDQRLREWYMGRLEELKRADLILGISEFACQEATERLQIPVTRTVPVMAAVEPFFRPGRMDAATAQSVLRRVGVTEKFVMYTGGIDPRKNIEGLVEAYSRLPHPMRQKYRLVIVCEAQPDQRRRLQALASRCGVAADELIFTGYISDEDLVALYRLCEVFVFPSLCEGFGLPALEAMACGAAVIGSDTSSIPEVIGDSEALFDPRDPASIAAKLRNVLNDEGLRARLRERGLRRAQEFSWDRCAERALGAMRRECDKRRAKRGYGKDQISVDRKPLLAYVSPLPPERSGIADYSAELLPVLSEHYRIEAVSDQPNVADPWIREHVPLRSYAWFEQNADRYDRVLYQIGNSAVHASMPTMLERHSGVVVLHEVFLSGLTSHLELASKVPGYWTRSLYESHGYQALVDRKALGDFERVLQRYPCSLPFIRDADGIIVHTQFSKKIADDWFGRSTTRKWAVVPHLRAVPATVLREQSRASLGRAEDDLLVCCFGIVGPFKRNLEILDAWFASTLGGDSHCHLTFVGAAHDPEYGSELERVIAEHGAGERVHITGWVDPETYRAHLAAADIAVQLRGSSRGEASGTALDCLAYGLPTIVNAHGPMAELPSDAVMLIPDAFDVCDLVSALERLAGDSTLRRELGQRGRDYCRQVLDPRRIASLYHDAIEKFAGGSSHRALERLIDRVSHIQGEPSRGDLEKLAAGIGENQPAVVGVRQLLVDISELVRQDAKSGIQRVVRSVLGVLLREPPTGFRVEPVYAEPGQRYRYARAFTSGFLDLKEAMPPDEPIDTEPGDVFLGLDLAPKEIPANAAQFEAMRQRGVKVCFVVYDQLPLRRTDCFPSGTYNLFNQWMEAVTRCSDGLVCISRAVQDEVREHLDALQVPRARPLRLGHFNLGADIGSSKPSVGITPEQTFRLEQLQSAPSFLVVGTIEPRKGHAQTLDAFEILWAAGQAANLLLIGKPGWMTEALTERIRNHVENGKRLVWFEQASDELLLRALAVCSALLAPSEGEGFGLPLIEAAQRGLPILCRDIPVFREVAGDHASYFSGYEGTDLAAAITNWLSLNADGAIPSSKMIPWKSWQQSAQDLLRVLLEDEWDGAWVPAENCWFPAYDPRTQTGVDKRTRGHAIAACSGETIIQIRPRAVPSGSYRFQVSGDWSIAAGTAQIELLSGTRQDPIATFELVAGKSHDRLLLDAPLVLHDRHSDLVVRITALSETSVEIAGCGLRPVDAATRTRMRAVAPASKPRILVDLTEITRLKVKTGVQRVTRNFFVGLAAIALEKGSFEVEPFCWKEDGIHYCRGFVRTTLGLPCEGDDGLVQIQSSDLVFMLDSSWWSPERFDDLHTRAHQAGGEVVWMVHDLIPIRFPDMCAQGMPAAFRGWLSHAVRVGDGFICNSETTRADLESFMDESVAAGARRPWARAVHLGCDLDRVADESGPEKSLAIRQAIGERAYFVALGTLEPRKDYSTIIDAFDLLWSRQSDAALVIVGRRGWNVDALVDRIQRHPELGHRLQWLEEASDADLRYLLGSASALIQASIWEGFGLPLIEAARLGVPLVVSDIAVFREIAGNHANYFPIGEATALAEVIKAILNGEQTRDSSVIPCRSWAEASLQLANVFELA